MKVQKGKRFVLTHGECDDYEVLGSYLALTSFDTDALVNVFLDIHPEQVREYFFETEDFEEWLVSRGTIKRLELTEWNVEAYSIVDAKLSLKHQACRDADIKERADEAAVQYAAHPEDFVSTSSRADVQVRKV